MVAIVVRRLERLVLVSKPLLAVGKKRAGGGPCRSKNVRGDMMRCAETRLHYRGPSKVVANGVEHGQSGGDPAERIMFCWMMLQRTANDLCLRRPTPPRASFVPRATSTRRQGM